MEYILIDMFKTGLPYALLALGIFISYRVLDIADLSCEGTFTLGGALSAVLLVRDVNPFLATLLGMFAGFIAGIITGLIHTKLNITALLSGIITMTGLFSINLVIMGFGNLNSDSGYGALVNLNGKDVNGNAIETIYNSFLRIFSLRAVSAIVIP